MITTMRRNVLPLVIVIAVGLALFVSFYHIHQLSTNSDRKEKLIIALLFISSLYNKEAKVYSQNREDGVTAAIFKQFGTSNKFYVEFGTQTGEECNTRYLREEFGWSGLLMDGDNENAAINLHKEIITPDNIVELLRKYEVPMQPDLFSLDTDFKDYWIWKRVLEAGYRPRVFITEVRAGLGNAVKVTVPEHTKQRFWEKTIPISQFSIAAGFELARKFGYSLLYCEKSAINCFWIRNDVVGIPLHDYIGPEELGRQDIAVPAAKELPVAFDKDHQWQFV